jgi:hypothetical protein
MVEARKILAISNGSYPNIKQAIVIIMPITIINAINKCLLVIINLLETNALIVFD